MMSFQLFLNAFIALTIFSQWILKRSSAEAVGDVSNTMKVSSFVPNLSEISEEFLFLFKFWNLLCWKFFSSVFKRTNLGDKYQALKMMIYFLHKTSIEAIIIVGIFS